MIPGTSARKLPTFISLTHQISWEGNKNPFFSGPILGIQSSLFKTTVPQETRTKICSAAWIAVSGQTGLRSDKNRLSQALSILFTRRQSRGGSRGGARGARPLLFTRGHSEQPCLRALLYIQNIPDFMGVFWPRFLKCIRIIKRFVTKQVMKCH